VFEQADEKNDPFVKHFVTSSWIWFTWDVPTATISQKKMLRPILALENQGRRDSHPLAPECGFASALCP
jgi:hypothetical protein